MEEVRFDIKELTEIRSSEPHLVKERAKSRSRRPFIERGGKLMLVAADHTARGVVAAAGNSRAMADRADMLARIVAALASPKVDGVLASADILEDLLLLGALENKLAIATMNRTGLAGSSFEFDDRIGAITPQGIKSMGWDAGKLLCRICLTDPATPAVLERCASTVDAMAELKAPLIIEPFISTWENGRVVNDLSVDSVIKSAVIAAGLGSTSAFTWLKLPVVAEMEEVVASTTLPVLLLGGESRADQEDMYTSWRNLLGLTQVKGLLVGRNVLYPVGDDYLSAITTASQIVHRNPQESP